MAWVSPKVYAILSKSEEGKDIIERLPDLTQDEASKEIDAFFGEGGKGFSSGEEYSQAKFDDEAEEERYKAIGDEEVSEKDYEDTEDDKKQKDEITDEDISIALDDNSWSITDDDSVDSYSKFVADKLGIEQEKVLSVMEKEAGRKLDMKEQMAKLAFPDEGEEPSDLDKSVFEKNYQQAFEINNYEKVKQIYDSQVQDKGADSPEAQGTKKALDEMEANFDQGNNREPKKLDDIIKERSTFTKDKDYDAYSFKKELEENGHKVEYIENRSGTWQDHNGEKFKEYDIKLEGGQHIYFKLIADENYDTKEIIAYKNGKNW